MKCLKNFVLIPLFFVCFSYGFEKNHCNEALTVSNGDVGLALELLLSQYFKLGVSFTSLSLPGVPQNGNVSKPLSADDLEYIATQREEEKTALESIYENSFEERVPNRVWVVKLSLDYLIDLYKPVTRHKKQRGDDDDEEILIQNVSSRNRRQQDICRQVFTFSSPLHLLLEIMTPKNNIKLCFLITFTFKRTEGNYKCLENCILCIFFIKLFLIPLISYITTRFLSLLKDQYNVCVKYMSIFIICVTLY